MLGLFTKRDNNLRVKPVIFSVYRNNPIKEAFIRVPLPEALEKNEMLTLYYAPFPPCMAALMVVRELGLDINIKPLEENAEDIFHWKAIEVKIPVFFIALLTFLFPLAAQCSKLSTDSC